jgi:ribonucleoside-diphosphate reductase alpha chain
MVKFSNIFSLSHHKKQDRLIGHVKSFKKNSKHHESRHLIIESVTAIDEKEDVYTLKMLDNTNEFILNGVVSSNCGEIPLHAYSVCNLWTINLVKHMDFYHRKLSTGKLRDTINVAVRAGDNLTTVNQYPREVPEIEKSAKEERRTGIDYTGIADYLYVSKIDYGSKEGNAEVDMLYKYLRDTARQYSSRLGKKKGNFPLYRKSDYSISDEELEYQQSRKSTKCPECGSALERFEDFIQCSMCNWAKFRYIRNMHLITQAPTGTRSRKLGVSFGIEPQFAKWYKSNVMEGREVYNVNRILEWYLKQAAEREGLDFQYLCEEIDKGTTVPELENWVEFQDLTPEQHLEVQAIAQRWIDQAVSKTINLPNEATVEDVKKMYMMAWEKKLKGITMYREGSHYKEVIGKDQSCPECGSKNLVMAEGCVQCKDCYWSKCSM